MVNHIFLWLFFLTLTQNLCSAEHLGWGSHTASRSIVSASTSNSNHHVRCAFFIFFLFISLPSAQLFGIFISSLSALSVLSISWWFSLCLSYEIGWNLFDSFQWKICVYGICLKAYTNSSSSLFFTLTSDCKFLVGFQFSLHHCNHHINSIYKNPYIEWIQLLLNIHRP